MSRSSYVRLTSLVLLGLAAVFWLGALYNSYGAYQNIDLGLVRARSAATAGGMSEEVVRVILNMDYYGYQNPTLVENLVAVRDKSAYFVKVADGSSTEYSAMMVNLRFALWLTETWAGFYVLFHSWWSWSSILLLIGASLLYKYGDRIGRRQERRRPRPLGWRNSAETSA